ncbi:MAG: response regulator transcription factor, partial [bacterium]|nr:response regulator transcription factor [bacterium]
LNHIWPQTLVIVTSRRDDPLALRQSLEGGARGFAVYGGDDLAPLMAVLARVRQGERAVCAVSMEHLIAAYLRQQCNPCEALLSPRETVVIELLADGASSEEIARTLYISPRTVKRRIGEILRKLDVHSRAEAVARFLGRQNQDRKASDAGGDPEVLHLRPRAWRAARPPAA